MADELNKMLSDIDDITKKLLKDEYVSRPDLEELKPPEEARARTSVIVDTGLQDQINLDLPAEEPDKNKVRPYRGDDLEVIQTMEELKMTSSEEELTNIMNQRQVECDDDLYYKMTMMRQRQTFLPLPPPVDLYLSTFEHLQIETLYRGLKTKVYVCSCAANLFFSSMIQVRDWDYQQTGVPVVVIENKGATNTLWLYFAELGTGLPYWKDIIDYNSSYSRSENPSLYYWRTSCDRRKRAALSFDCEGSATRFYLHICSLTSQLENIGVSLPKIKSNARRTCKPKRKPFSKSQISEPSCFAHITSVRPTDRYKSLQSFVTSAPEEDVQESYTTWI